ncbi:MAG: translation initiation factor IF-3 [Gammaproteobacteria bacterium]|nr:translation initiation factor IF-3 [Gammaproteobacteria bacterium]
MEIAAQKKTLLNEEIRYPEIRVISDDGEQLGIMSSADALGRAQEVGLDLVEVSPNANPPVCRIMDFGKFRFESSKKQQASKKKQKRTQIKEIKFRPRTEEGDYQVKLKKLRNFLEKGDKTKVTMRYRGREFAHQELGMDLLKRVEADLEDIANVEQMPNMEGRQMVMLLGPKKTK